MRQKSISIYLVLFILLLFVGFLAGRFANADGADLKSFLYDQVSFDVIGYEPVFSVIQLFFQIFSIYLPLEFIPSLIVATSISVHIARSHQPVYIKIFWATTLILPLSMQYFRVGSLFFLMLFIPIFPKYYGMLVHWSYILLLTSTFMRMKQLLLAVPILIVFYFLFFEYVESASGKVLFYMETDFDSRWGVVVYFELIGLAVLNWAIYKNSGANISSQVLILLLSFCSQLLSLHVVASRLNLLSVAVSLIELKDLKAKRMPLISLVLMGVIAIYQILRFSTNIPNTNIYDFFG